MRLAPMMIVLAALALTSASAAAADLPADVKAFVAEREQCDHFRGEEGYDAERQREIEAALDTYCRGTDQRLKALKAKYRNGSAAVRTVLDAFETQIEP